MQAVSKSGPNIFLFKEKPAKVGITTYQLKILQFAFNHALRYAFQYSVQFTLNSTLFIFAIFIIAHIATWLYVLVPQQAVNRAAQQVGLEKPTLAENSCDQVHHISVIEASHQYQRLLDEDLISMCADTRLQLQRRKQISLWFKVSLQLINR